MSTVQVTIWVALSGYLAASAILLAAPRSRPWQAGARLFWTFGWVAFLLHVASAFHYNYQWSHAIAWRETARDTQSVTGISSGFGIYLNYLFTLAWTADTLSWWKLGLEGYRRRPRWIGMVWHGFFLFMAFNAVVVFEEGAIRWIGLLACLLLLGLRLSRKPAPRPNAGRPDTRIRTRVD